MKSKIIEKLNKLEVINDTLVGTLQYYEKIEDHFKEPTDSVKLKLLIKNTTQELEKIINDFFAILNQ